MARRIDARHLAWATLIEYLMTYPVDLAVRPRQPY